MMSMRPANPVRLPRFPQPVGQKNYVKSWGEGFRNGIYGSWSGRNAPDAMIPRRSDLQEAIGPAGMRHGAEASGSEPAT